MKTRIIIVFVVALIILSGGFLLYPRRISEPENGNRAVNEATVKNENVAVNDVFEIIADNLKIPWEIAFLPEGDMLVTERPGAVKRIGKDKRVYNIEGVEHAGEGGLLGLALHPKFSENNFIYLYLKGPPLGHRARPFRHPFRLGRA